MLCLFEPLDSLDAVPDGPRGIDTTALDGQFILVS